MKPIYCDECDAIEQDPIMLDLETCSMCGGYLKTPEDDDEDDGK